MANVVKHKRSSTAGETPAASDLEVGEIAINTADAKLFVKHTDGNVVEISGSGGGGGSALVWTSALANTGTTNYWAKVATYAITGAYNDGSFLYAFLSEESGTPSTAIVQVSVRRNGSGQANGVDVELISAPNAAPFSDDSFKLLDDGAGTDIELWVKKNANYHSMKAFEIGKNTESVAVTYNQNATWQATEPTGTGNNTKSDGIKHQGNKIWHAGNDGANSGLDADLLDGQHGSYYLNLANATGEIAEATSSAHGGLRIGYSENGKNYPVELNSDGQAFVNVPWVDTDTNTTYSTATSSALGLVKIGYTESGKNYPVELDNGQMYVNVPWTDNNTTYSTATSSTAGLVKIGYTESGKNYPVELDNGQMYVNVPWTDTDTNTTYSAGTAIDLSGTTFSLSSTISGKRDFTGGVVISNPSSVGHIQMGNIGNDQQNAYIRGAFLVQRNEDQITYDSSSDTWTHAGGSSTDWSMWAHTASGMRFYTGASVSSSTDYTPAQFDNAYLSVSIGTDGQWDWKQAAQFSGNVTISGNLTVSGSTTTVNSGTINLADSVLTLNSDLLSTVDPTENAGFEVNRGTGSTVGFIWNETNDEWTAATSNGTYYKIWHAGNDGSGSGLDADKLDGVHGSSFLRSDAADTASGQITFTGKAHVNTNTNTQPLVVSRGGSNASQRLNIGVTDTQAIFNYVEDTTSEGNGNFGSYLFQLGGNDGETTLNALSVNKTSTRITTNSGYIQLGPSNSSWSHITTDRPMFYFNKGLAVETGVVRSYDEDLNLNRAGSATARIRIANGITYSDQDFEGKQGANFGANTLTADGQNDVFMFATSPTSATAQSGAFHNKLRILGGSSQTRDLQLYQRDSEYSHIGSSWTSNQLHVDSAFTQVHFNQPLHIPDYIYHKGDTDTYLHFEAANTWRVVTGGSTRFRINNSEISNYRPTQIHSSATAWDGTTPGTSRGALHLNPSNTSANVGMAITFGAHDSSNGDTAQAGIYTRTNGSYGTNMYLATTDSYANGAKTAVQINYNGTVEITRSDLYVPNKIIHRGDTDTYMQFDAANSWRIVTGGSTRLTAQNSGLYAHGHTIHDAVIGYHSLGATQGANPYPYRYYRITSDLTFDDNRGYEIFIDGDDNYGYAGLYHIWISSHNSSGNLDRVRMTYVSGEKRMLEVILASDEHVWIRSTQKWGNIRIRALYANEDVSAMPFGTLEAQPSNAQFTEIEDFEWNGDNNTKTQEKNWHSNNDGSGSGLDADLLDGVQGSSYLRSDQNDTFSGQLTVSTTNDAQILLQSTNTWTGIGFNDSGSNNEYIWHNGGNGTFAIGGGGSNVSGKKLHIDGGTTIGVNYDATSTHTNGLKVEGHIETAGEYYAPNKIIHTGDTDTYMQFDAANSWRVVTGGGEAFKVTADEIIAQQEVRIENGNSTTTHFAYNNESGSENYIRGTKLQMDTSETSVVNGLRVGASGSNHNADGLEVNAGTDEKIVLSGTSNPYIRWQEGTTDRFYIQWRSGSDAPLFRNQQGDYFDFMPDASTGAVGLRLRGGDDDTWGYLYGNDSQQVGLLDEGGSWAIKHVNDTGTYFYTDGGTEEFRVGRDAVTGNYGTVETTSNKGGWGGYSIGGDWVFMANGTAEAGLYNDTDNEWAVKFYRNAETRLYHNGSESMRTIGVNGIRVGSPSSNSSDIYMSDNNEGTRRIHCNSNRLGFLNSSNAWSFYSEDGGRVVAESGIYNKAVLDMGTTGSLQYKTNDNGGYIPHPRGGSYNTSSSSKTGAIEIAFPTAAYGAADMLTFWVDVFDYSNHESVSLFIAGYLYQTSTGNEWVNCEVVNLSGNTAKDYTVRFGADTSRNKVWIGETNSTWSYPQVLVRDLHVGYSANINSYDTGFALNFVTSFSTVVDEVHANNFPIAKYAQDADKLDGLTSGSFIRSDADDNVSAHTEWQDNKEIRFGNGADFRIFNNGTHQYFKNYNHAGGNIYFQGEDAEGTNHALLYMYTGNSNPYVSIYQNGGERLRTLSGGVGVTGLCVGDVDRNPHNSGGLNVHNGSNEKIVLSGSNDPYIRWQEGTTDKAYIQWQTAGHLLFRNQENGNFVFRPSGTTSSVYLRFEASDGDVYGGVYATHSNEVGFLDDDSQWAYRIATDSLHEWRINNTVEMSLSSSTLDMKGNTITEVEDIGLRDRIYHDGDTNCYIQFHATDQWRVVTGGVERFEVNNSQITSAEPIYAPFFKRGTAASLDIDNSGGVNVSDSLDFLKGEYIANTDDATVLSANEGSGLWLWDNSVLSESVGVVNQGAWALSSKIKTGSTQETYPTHSISGGDGVVAIHCADFKILYSPDGTSNPESILSFDGSSSAWVWNSDVDHGIAADGVFWENKTAVVSNYTITNNKNAMSAGPITIINGVTVTVGDGETWTVV